MQNDDAITSIVGLGGMPGTKKDLELIRQVAEHRMRGITNNSGLTPVEFKVLVKPDDVELKTSGGLYIPEALRDKERMAQVKATLIQSGGNAFEDWKDPKPCMGSRVYVAKYAGLRIKGKDDEWYQLVNDKDICALIED